MSITELRNRLKELKKEEKIIEKTLAKRDIDQAIPYQEIVAYLNQTTHSRYAHDSKRGKKTRTLINARWQEGWRLEDFRYVISVKALEWLGTEHEKYLRPETLFGTKFESYRNQKPDRKKLVKKEVKLGDGWT